jgi:hypothetical protein
MVDPWQLPGTRGPSAAHAISGAAGACECQLRQCRDDGRNGPKCHNGLEVTSGNVQASPRVGKAVVGGLAVVRAHLGSGKWSAHHVHQIEVVRRMAG